jgi:hypothetical protein
MQNFLKKLLTEKFYKNQVYQVEIVMLVQDLRKLVMKITKNCVDILDKNTQWKWLNVKKNFCRAGKIAQKR